ncbi:MAG TPA: enoyl-CoA hydratase [Dehalococcoidia bacterium]|nr:enoyl-CoA hydratase [Dehalococcoidia bacterium]
MPITGSDILLYEKKDRIVIITMNRPERMNALSLELIDRFQEVWRGFQADEDAWVAILTGAGEKSFCAGFDLIDQAERDQAGGQFPDLPLWWWPLEIWKPIIAAINGYAIAGGWLMAQACDIRIAAEHAEMGIAEARWNLPAWWVADLTRQLNLAHALEIVLWGDRRITAQRAYEMGWVNRVVPKERLMEEAMSWAERMLYLGPRAVRNLKEILYRCYYMPPRMGYNFARALERNLEGMEDIIEGPRAFAEKRKPQFKNR